MTGDSSQELNSLHPLSDKLAVGEEFQLSIRPEEITILPFQKVSNSDNLIPGIITNLFFTGSLFEAEIQFSGETNITLSIPRTYDWHKGQKVYLSFPQEASRLWKIRN